MEKTCFWVLPSKEMPKKSLVCLEREYDFEDLTKAFLRCKDFLFEGRVSHNFSPKKMGGKKAKKCVFLGLKMSDSEQMERETNRI